MKVFLTRKKMQMNKYKTKNSNIQKRAAIKVNNLLYRYVHTYSHERQARNKGDASVPGIFRHSKDAFAHTLKIPYNKEQTGSNIPGSKYVKK